MSTLYDILGVPEDASNSELRRAYHLAARRMHPDVNLNLDTTEDMRRLNRAWAVLGDPESRRAYDRDRRQPAPPLADETVRAHPLARLVRPSALIVAVLLVIFVVTAYAGPRANDRNAPLATVPSTTGPEPVTAGSPVPGALAPDRAAGNLLGDCIQVMPGYDAVVPCGSANDGEVVAEVAAFTDCPEATRPHQLIGQAQVVCLTSAPR